MKLGLIGFGRLGKLLTKYLAQDFSLYVYDTNTSIAVDVHALGGQTASLEEVCALPAIILSVPISQMQTVLQEMRQYDLKDKLVIDTCSVKSLPEEWMRKHLPGETHLLGTHPMFGPDSAGETLFGAKIVLTQIRTPSTTYNNIKSYLEQNGLKVIEASSKTHDTQIAESLVLTHFIGRGLMDFGASKKQIDTKGHRRLMKILLTVQNDAWQLFEDMNRYNPYAADALGRFKNSLESIYKKVQS